MQPAPDTTVCTGHFASGRDDGSAALAAPASATDAADTVIPSESCLCLMSVPLSLAMRDGIASPASSPPATTENCRRGATVRCPSWRVVTFDTELTNGKGRRRSGGFGSFGTGTDGKMAA